LEIAAVHGKPRLEESKHRLGFNEHGDEPGEALMMKRTAIAIILTLLSHMTGLGQLSLIVGGPAKSTPVGTSRAQANATVRSIINKNAGPCRINKIRSIAAVRSGAGWRVTARLVMSASGRRLNETATWTVTFDNRQAVAANQLAAELETGCP
jgi:hypothetical protein